MKNLEAENPCSMGILTRGGGQDKAFTMAEILLSLTIIGVVAAITLPSLTGNINERTWNTQRKALYARFSQAIALMPALNGYGTLTEDTDSAGSTSITDTAAETFVTSGLAKVLKINNICDYEHLEDCGIPDRITNMAGSTISNFNTSPYNTLAGYNNMFNGSYSTFTYSQVDTKAVAFETANGESILAYYNPNCQADMQETSYYSQPKMCANFVYDLNGTKGPNTMGKDIGFITVLYPSDPVVVAPLPLNFNTGSRSENQVEAGASCKAMDEEGRLPNREELSAMFYNRTLLGADTEGRAFWSSSVISGGESGYGWRMSFDLGNIQPHVRSNTGSVWCIKR